MLILALPVTVIAYPVPNDAGDIQDLAEKKE